MTSRELILKRLEEIRTKEQNFNKQTTRWRTFTTDTNVASDTKHISEIDFSQLDDVTLVPLFERIIRRYYTQM